MSTSNGKITAPVTIGDVAQTIGVASGDLGTLCTSGNINKWSKYKPINRVARTGDGMQYVHPLTDIDFADSRYGLKYPTYHALQVGDNPAWCTFHFDSLLGDFNSEQESQENVRFLYNNFEANLINPNDGLFYGKPFGKVTYLYNEISKTYYSPYRLSDFDKYEHGSVAPLASAGLQPIDVYKDGVYAGTDYKITIEVKRATEGYNGLTVDSMISDYTNFPSETLSDWYLCVLIFDRFGGTCYGMFNCEGSTDKYYKIGSSSTSFTFEAKSDYLRRLSNMFANTGHFALLSIVPTIMRQNFASFDNNGFYPTFSYKTTDGKTLLNSFLPMERGVWWLDKISILGLVLCGKTDVQGIELSRYVFKTKVYTEEDAAYKDMITSYTYNDVWVDSTETNYYGDKCRIGDFATGFKLYAGKDMRDVVASNKRNITIGDYNSGQTEFYMQKTITSSDAGKIRPLFQCKAMVDGNVYNAMFYLEFILTSNNAPAAVYLRLRIEGQGTLSPFENIGNGYFTNLKSLVFKNIVDDNDNIIGLQIDYYTIDWSKYQNVLNEVADDASLNYITHGSISYLAAEGDYPFINTDIAENSVILDTNLLDELKVYSIIDAEYTCIKMTVGEKV